MGWLWSEEFRAFYFVWPTWFVWLQVIVLVLFALMVFRGKYPSLDGEKSV